MGYTGNAGKSGSAGKGGCSGRNGRNFGRIKQACFEKSDYE